MKHIFAIVAVIAALLFCAHSQVGSQGAPKAVANNKYCRRYITSNIAADNKMATLYARSKCNANKAGVKRSSYVMFRLASDLGGLPRMRVSNFNDVKSATADSSSSFTSIMGFERIVEFNETNGTPGFQNGQDQIIDSYMLRDGWAKRPNGAKWSPITMTTTPISSDSNLYSLSMSLPTPWANADSVSLGIDITEVESSKIVGNKTLTRYVLAPNSLKVDFNINNIKSYKTGTTGIAISVLLFTKSNNVTRRAPVENSNISPDTAGDQSIGDRPDDHNADQSVSDIADEVNSAQNTGFFSFKRWFFNSDVNGTVSKARMLDSAWEVMDDTDPEYTYYKTAGFNVKRIWITPAGLPKQISWDPSVGVVETIDDGSVAPATSTNSANSVLSSFSALLIILLIALVL